MTDKLKVEPGLLSVLAKGKGLTVPKHVLEKEVSEIQRPTKLLQEHELEEIFRILASGETPDRTKYGITSWEMDELTDHFNAAQRNEIYVDTSTSN